MRSDSADFTDKLYAMGVKNNRVFTTSTLGPACSTVMISSDDDALIPGGSTIHDMRSFVEQRVAMLSTAGDSLRWGGALLRVLTNVQFQDARLEAAFQQWCTVAYLHIQSWSHTLVLLLIGVAMGSQLSRGIEFQVSLLVIFIAMLTLWCVNARLIWRRRRLPLDNIIIGSVHNLIACLIIVATATCTEWCHAFQCDFMRLGVWNGTHFLTAFANMLMLAYSFHLQVPWLILHMSVFFAVWWGLFLRVAPVALSVAVTTPIALGLLLALLVVQAHGKQNMDRLQFQMVVELSQQLKDKQQAVVDMELAHRDTLAEQESKVRLTTTREIHEGMMGFTCHNWRNPLHALRGIMIEMRKQCVVGHTIDVSDYEGLELIDDAVTQLTRATDALFDFQRLHNGTLPTKAEPANVVDLIQQAVLPITQNCSINIHTHIADDVPKQIICDGTRVTEMVSIGLSNAIRFQNPNTAIQIRAFLWTKPGARTAGYLMVEVWNEGKGLGSVDVKYLFEPYDRTDERTAPKQGAGIGLQASRLLGGNVDLEDRGKFTVYYFYIPLVHYEPEPAPIAPPLPSANNSRMLLSAHSSGEMFHPELALDSPYAYWGRAPERSSGVYHCMVVDDLRSNRRLLMAMLKKMGHFLHELDDGDQIAGALEAGVTIDVLLLDIHMVRTDGRDVARFLREYGHTFPIIAVTANVSTADIISYRKAGFDGVIGKPFTAHHVAQLLQIMREGGQSDNLMVRSPMVVSRPRSSAPLPPLIQD